MNKVDREILEILKDILFKKANPMESDHNIRLWFIRGAFFVSVAVLISRVSYEVAGRDITAEFSSMVNTPIAVFFTLLFIHINNEVEETSVIIMVLTWVSLMISLYV